MKILKFYAGWCGPCKVQTTLLKDIPVPTQEINVEDENNEDLVEKYAIRNLPTLVILNSTGDEIKRFSGLTQKETIKDFIKEYEETGNI